MMRILIVDDNIALQDILTEIVSDAGHASKTAPSAEGALSYVDSFRPDVILLDTDMHDGEGFTFLDRMQNSTPPIDIPVVVIRSWNRPIPQDVYVIKGHIEKPFTAQDVTESIDRTQIKEEEGEGHAEDAAVQPAETREEAPRETLTDRGISFGESYVMFRSGHEAVHDLISLFGSEGYDVLVVTTGKRKKIKERFRSRNIKAMALSIKLFSGHFDIYGLGTMIDNVDEFIARSGRPVVAFEDMNKMIDRNGMNSVLTAVHELITKKYDKERTFLVSVDPKGFTTKDKEILLNHMSQIGE